jgi:putative ABC transport system ATP-binding protein
VSAGEVVLELIGVTKIYGQGDTAVKALDNVSLAVNSGEVVAVMGTSGSGKSTLLAIAGGLVKPTSGSVLVGGEDLGSLKRRALSAMRRRRIGFVFQDFNLIPGLTALENVALPLELDGVRGETARSEARRALAAVELRGRGHSYPDELSGGQQQRVAIARAMVGTRSLVLADEPTGALDSVIGDGVLSVLHQRAQDGAAVVLVTHDARHASWADRIVFLRDGRVADEFTADGPEALLTAHR